MWHFGTTSNNIGYIEKIERFYSQITNATHIPTTITFEGLIFLKIFTWKNLLQNIPCQHVPSVSHSSQACLHSVLGRIESLATWRTAVVFFTVSIPSFSDTSKYILVCGQRHLKLFEPGVHLEVGATLEH